MSPSQIIALCMAAYAVGALSMIVGIMAAAKIAGRRWLRGW